MATEQSRSIHELTQLRCKRSSHLKRVHVHMPAIVRKYGHREQLVHLVDLSQAGFLMQFNDSLQLGERLHLSFSLLGSVSAFVRWRDKYQYGCEFEIPLHPSIFEHIIKSTTSYPA